jgi:hypothetical protein
MTSEGLDEMFEGDFPNMWADKFTLMLMGGRATPSSLLRWVAMSPISVSENLADINCVETACTAATEDYRIENVTLMESHNGAT